MAGAFPFVPIVNLDSDSDDDQAPSLSVVERERAADFLLPPPMVQIPAYFPADFKKIAYCYTSAEVLRAVTDLIILTKDGYDDRLEVVVPSPDERVYHWRPANDPRHFCYFYTFMFDNMGIKLPFSPFISKLLHIMRIDPT